MPDGLQAAGAILLAGLSLWLATAVGPVPVAMPSAMPNLAVMGGFPSTFRPLFADNPADRRILRQIGEALGHATQFGSPPPQGMGMPTLQPDLTLGYAAGESIQILTDFAQSGMVPDWVVVGFPDGKSVLLRSRFLYDLLTRRNRQVFRMVQPLQVSVQGRTLRVRGSGIAGASVTLRIQPQLRGAWGGSPSPGFLLATVPVRDGHYRWAGPVHLPAGWHVFHPVAGWQLDMAVNPLPAFPSLGTFGTGQSLPLSLIAPVAPVASP